MSIKRMVAVWEKSQHSGGDLLLLLALADYANENGLSWAGMAKLAERTRTARRNVPRRLDKLCASGELVVLNRAFQQSNISIVTVGLTEEELVAAWDQAHEMGAVSIRGQDDLTLPPQVLEVVKVTSGGGVTSPGCQGSHQEDVRGDIKGMHDPSSYPSLDPIHSKKSAADAAEPVQESVPTSFEEWLDRIEKPPKGSNRTAQLVFMYQSLWPNRKVPSYGYMGKVAGSVGGGGRMASLLWQAAGARCTGDPLAYAKAIARGRGGKKGLVRGGAGNGQDNHEWSAEDLEVIRAGLARERELGVAWDSPAASKAG